MADIRITNETYLCRKHYYENFDNNEFCGIIYNIDIMKEAYPNYKSPKCESCKRKGVK